MRIYVQKKNINHHEKLHRQKRYNCEHHNTQIAGTIALKRRQMVGDDANCLWQMARDAGTTISRRIDVLEELLKLRPRHAKAMALLAILLANAHSEKNEERIAELVRRAVELRPLDASLWVARARLCVGNSEEKGRMLRRALELEPRNFDAGCMLLCSGDAYGKSEEKLYAGFASSLKDCDVEKHYSLGIFFRRRDAVKSRMHFSKVVSGADSAPGADPMDLVVKANFWLATLGVDDQKGGSKVTRCPQIYITSLYKSFAPKFDELLVEKLQYRTPALLRDAMIESRASEEGNSLVGNALDLGCGTGLSGAAFRSVVREDAAFVGIDLSPEMLIAANARRCYSSTHCADVEDFGDIDSVKGAAPFSLVLACDVFVYLGSLAKVFASVRRVVKEGSGLFCFSVEELREGAEDGAEGYECMAVAR